MMKPAPIPFYNRSKEIAELEKLLSSGKFQFHVLWGRRRVGKTALLRKVFLNRSDVPFIYFLATELEEQHNIALFKRTVHEVLEDGDIGMLRDDWEVLFQYLAKRRVVVVVDEFPYLLAGNKAVKSVFQRIIDLHWSQTKNMLVLCGSSIKMMNSEVLSSNSPLYGRRTSQRKLDPLEYPVLKEFLPSYPLEDLVMTYSVLGGIPYYLEQFNPSCHFWDNILDQCLNPSAVLFEEANLLLRQEFDQLHVYNTILAVIAGGETELSKIKNKVGGVRGEISSYLHNLTEVGLVEKRVPFGEDPLRSRKGRYYLTDHYLRFWYHYILPNKTLLMRGRTDEVLSKIKQSFNSFVGLAFEDLVHEWLMAGALTESRFPLRPSSVGRWWHKDVEVDWIASDGSNYAFVEVKWSTLTPKEVQSVVTRLRAKVQSFSKPRGQEFYVVVARKILDREKISLPDTLVYDLHDLFLF